MFEISLVATQAPTQISVGTASDGKLSKAWKLVHAQLVETTQTKPSSSNPLWEKGDVLYVWKQASWVYVPTLTSSVRHPMTHVLPTWKCVALLDFLLCAGWNGLPPTPDILHFGCSHPFLSTWGVVILVKTNKKRAFVFYDITSSVTTKRVLPLALFLVVHHSYCRFHYE